MSPVRSRRPGNPAAMLSFCAGLALSVASLSIAPAAHAQTSRTAAAAPAAAGSADQVPIRKIVLYRSGVGYFERSGVIDGNAEVQLRFNAEQINDILKSMVLLDLGGGRIDTVSYASKEPLARRLASFGVNIANNPSIPELLGQLRGAPVSVLVAGAQVQGTVLGVEDRQLPAAPNQPASRALVLNLVTGTGLKSIAISDISSLDILDKELAAELTKALATLAEYRADRTKTVDLRFAGQGSRRVVVGYVHEMPVWKTSYRLVIPEEQPRARGGEGGAGSRGEVMIQGWAIVENTTDQDWDNVTMALVSGRPVSFQMDLYEPLYTFRPMVPVPTIPGVMPRSYAGGIEAPRDKATVQSGGAPGRPPAAAAPAPEGAARRMRAAVAEAAADADVSGMYAGIASSEMLDYAAAAQAQAGEVGEVFQYQLDMPVSIERQRSAMIPILSATIPGRRVSIFSMADGSEHPMRGVEIVNDSNLQLLPGPISVSDGSSYAGDAQIGHVGQGDKRLLAYSVDLDVRVQTRHDHQSNITKLRIVNGLFEQTIQSRQTVTYTIRNGDEKRARTLYIEHPRDDNWKLVTPAKPDDQTQTHLRFVADVGAGKTQDFTVAAERVFFQSFGVLDMDVPTAIAHRQNGRISEAVLGALRRAADLQAAVNETERRIRGLNEQTAAIGAEQARIRENLARLGQGSALADRYIAKLNDQETELEGIASRRTEAQSLLDQQRRALNEYIRGLNVE
ncbi:MAG: hypothetical protein KF869_05790 [Phycisphaeraceae bacterium]|nr:hypothetical protein [Phycisphaeraceae bacterium]